MREAARASYGDEARQWRDMNTPLSAIEKVIADALTATMTGEEFAAALDKAGITIARADATDIAALEALREEADWRGSRRIPTKRTSTPPGTLSPKRAASISSPKATMPPSPVPAT